MNFVFDSITYSLFSLRNLLLHCQPRKMYYMYAIVDANISVLIFGSKCSQVDFCILL